MVVLRGCQWIGRLRQRAPPDVAVMHSALCDERWHQYTVVLYSTNVDSATVSSCRDLAMPQHAH